MSKRNIMLALNQVPDGSQPKNPFDLSHGEASTSKLGQYLPVGCIETVPDADYDIGVDNYTFTMPCNTASLAKMKENYYFLFVPYSQIINSSYSFFVNRKDLQSALDYNDQKIPFFNLGDVVYRCIERCVTPGDLVPDIHGFHIYEGALRLLDLLGYGCYLDFLDMIRNGDMTLAKFRTYCTNVLNKKKPNILRIAAYQKTWYCYFRNPIFDLSGNYYITPRSFNFDDVVYHTSGQSESYNVLDHRDIDNFICECLQVRYVGYKKDLFTAFMPGTQYGAVSSISASLTLPVELTGTVTGDTGNDYQRWYKIGAFQEDGSLDQNDTNMLFQNNALVNYPGVDPENPVKGNLKGVHSQYDEDDQMYVYGTKVLRHEHGINLPVTLSGSGQSAASLFDVLQLVEAQAVQKWRQKSMLAGQRSINQYRAHFGDVPRHMEDHYPDFIGSVDNPILIDRVVNSANTASDTASQTNLGDLGGRGYGASSNRTFHFHSSEHGIIIVCRAIIPENTYSSYGLDRANQLINMTDFPIPEYQNIGLEALPKILLDSNINDNESPVIHPSSGIWNAATRNSVFGYAPRNYQLKQYPPKVHGRLNPTRLQQFHPEGYLPYGFSDLQCFVMPRLDLNANIIINATGDISVARFALTTKLFYVSPSMANSCFMVDADSTEMTDQFIHVGRIICKSVQPLSVIGLPQF